ncbi:MAG: hypothetical protein OEV46_05560, partial [Betaproteobacteria bacterium]|nr:hypothetical protein [Betaproteobacteria bacterium]
MRKSPPDGKAQQEASHTDPPNGAMGVSAAKQRARDAQGQVLPPAEGGGAAKGRATARCAGREMLQEWPLLGPLPAPAGRRPTFPSPHPLAGNLHKRKRAARGPPLARRRRPLFGLGGALAVRE